MPPTPITRRRAWALLCVLRRLPPEERRACLPAAGAHYRAIEEEWWWQAHGEQIEPPASAGAGAGAGVGPVAGVADQGRARLRQDAGGAEWVWARVREWGQVAAGKRGRDVRVPAAGPIRGRATPRTGRMVNRLAMLPAWLHSPGDRAPVHGLGAD